MAKNLPESGLIYGTTPVPAGTWESITKTLNKRVYCAYADLGWLPDGSNNCTALWDTFIAAQTADRPFVVEVPLRTDGGITQYRFDSTISWPGTKPGALIGQFAGSGNTTGSPGVRFNANFSSAILLDLGDGTNQNHAGASIRNIALQQLSTGVTGLRIRGTTNWDLDRVSFKDLTIGLQLATGGGGLDNAWNRITDCLWWQCNTGVDSGDAVGYNMYNGKFFVPDGAIGIDLTSAQSCKHYGTFFDGTGAGIPNGTAIRFAGGSGNTGTSFSAAFNEFFGGKFESIDLCITAGGSRDSSQGHGNAVYGFGAAGCGTVFQVGSGATGTQIKLTGIQDSTVDGTDAGLNTKIDNGTVRNCTTINFPSRPVITGSRGGNAALADLLAELHLRGIIDNQSTA